MCVCVHMRVCVSLMGKVNSTIEGSNIEPWDEAPEIDEFQSPTDAQHYPQGQHQPTVPRIGSSSGLDQQLVITS